MIEKLVFDKIASKLYCWNTDGECYAEFPICFNYWGLDDKGNRHTPIANGIYPVTNENDYALEHGHKISDSLGTFWIALDRETGKGFHGYGDGRSLTSGTYGCIRGKNEDGEEVCRAVEKSIAAGITVTAEVTGDIDEEEAFRLDGAGEQ